MLLSPRCRRGDRNQRKESSAKTMPRSPGSLSSQSQPASSKGMQVGMLGGAEWRDSPQQREEDRGMLPAEGALTWPGARGAPGRPERTPTCVGWLTARGVSSREARCSCMRCKDPPLGRSGVGHRPVDHPRGSIPNPPPDGCAQRWTDPSSRLQRLPRVCPWPGSWESMLPIPLFGWGPMPPPPPGPGVQHCTWH